MRDDKRLPRFARQLPLLACRPCRHPWQARPWTSAAGRDSETRAVLSLLAKRQNCGSSATNPGQLRGRPSQCLQDLQLGLGAGTTRLYSKLSSPRNPAVVRTEKPAFAAAA